MYKNYTISALGAVLAVKSIPGFDANGAPVLVAAFAGFFIPLLFFCFFCDGCAQKWRAWEKGKRQLAAYIRNLR